MDCTDLDEVAPELVLDLLDGAQRGAAMAHLETCDACRRLVDTLATDADRLLVLAPPAEPPAGFEHRVLASLANLTQPAQPAQPAPPAPPRVRAWRRPRAFGTLALAACVALVAVVLSLGPSSRPALAEADMRTSGGEVVGQVFVHPNPRLRCS
jgi:ferric-dicitrate binding protein FerR (iron transport regulator)